MSSIFYTHKISIEFNFYVQTTNDEARNIFFHLWFECTNVQPYGKQSHITTDLEA